MKLRTRTAIFSQSGETIPPGAVVDVPAEVASDWISRGLADEVSPAPEVVATPAEPKPPPAAAVRSHHAKPAPKDKKGRR